MTDRAPGPASYFPSIEKRYGRPVDEWLQVLRDRIAAEPGSTHGQLVTWMKAEHGLGHGHATALVAHTLAGRR